MDRFIPSDSSVMAYHALPNTLTNRRSMPNLFSAHSTHEAFPPNIEDFVQTNSRRTSTADARLFDRPSSSPRPKSEQSSEPAHYKDIIAQALGFGSKKGVLKFEPSSKNSKGSKSSYSQRANSGKRKAHTQKKEVSDISIDSAGPLSLDISCQISAMCSENFTERSETPNKKPKKKIQMQIPFKILDAHGLRNDFYTNLISWSKLSGNVAVGLGVHIYLWNKNRGAIPLPVSGYDLITTLVFSDFDFLLAGTKSGNLALYSQESEGSLAEYKNLGGGVCCACWIPDSSTSFYVGTEIGRVNFFEVVKSTNGYCLKLVTTFKTHEQQVCGIAISSDKKQIAIGGNDNCCTLWDISTPDEPVLKYTLRHHAAVKAIAFCPWSKSLLATGGGSRDRTIRFWHTNSGTLLESLNTKGQITALVWSRSKKQIVATFGFGDSANPLLMSVYSYPNIEPVVQVPATSDLRVLSAIVSPDHKTICVAANDQTVRFYELWSAHVGLAADAQEGGVFGSDLIELCEGINKNGDVIR